MPVIQVTTNVALDKTLKKTLLEKLTAVIVDVIGKPKKYAMVQLIDGITASFNGTDDPTAFVKVLNVGSLSSKVSDAIVKVLEKNAKIKKERVYVQFVKGSFDNFFYYVKN